MARRSVPVLKGALGTLVAALLLGAPALAGDRVRAPSRPTTGAQPASAPVARVPAQPVTISFVVTQPSQPAREPLSVALRGPDGQVRRFVVEGGLSAIQYRQVVLRPGQSVSIRWMAAK